MILENTLNKVIVAEKEYEKNDSIEAENSYIDALECAIELLNYKLMKVL